MTGIQAYVLANNTAKSISAGVKSYEVDGTKLIINTNDGKKLIMEFPIPESDNITDMYLNDDIHLIIEMESGKIIDAGEVPNVTIDDVIYIGNTQPTASQPMWVDTTESGEDVDYATDEDIEEILNGGD